MQAPDFLGILSISVMPRTSKRKTQCASYTTDAIHAAIVRIQQHGEKVRKVTRETGIDKSTLSRYVRKSTDGIPVNIGYWGNKRVFTGDQEIELVDYLITSCKMYYSLAPIEVRRLAYELADKNGISMPYNWMDNSLAGEDWFARFVKRHKEISIRTPEATSLGHAACFNKTNVAAFFENLTDVKSRYNFAPKDIWNVDETGCNSEPGVVKVVAPTGVKQVGAIAGADDRGKLVTICCAVNAVGHALPPMFIFPRVHFKTHFIQAGPVESIGTSYPTG